MAVDNGELSKLKFKLISYASDGMPEVSESDSYTVQINPASFSLNKRINYQDNGTPGTTEKTNTFTSSGPSSISFEIVFDGTGVVNTQGVLDAIPIVGALAASSDESFEVEDQIKNFEAIVYLYDGEIHQPNKVQISWGTMLFDGALSSISYSHTLFRPNGTALRVKANCTFQGTKSEKQIALEQSNASPDLTHIREIKDGDSLPLLAHKIYGNAALYLELARVNKLVNFRRLQSGTRLSLPPVDKGAA